MNESLNKLEMTYLNHIGLIDPQAHSMDCIGSQVNHWDLLKKFFWHLAK